jgi:hypothetical protein
MATEGSLQAAWAQTRGQRDLIERDRVTRVLVDEDQRATYGLWRVADVEDDSASSVELGKHARTAVLTSQPSSRRASGAAASIGLLLTKFSTYRMVWEQWRPAAGLIG